MSLFVLASKDGWVNIMYTGLDAVGIDQQVCSSMLIQCCDTVGHATGRLSRLGSLMLMAGQIRRLLYQSDWLKFCLWNIFQGPGVM